MLSWLSESDSESDEDAFNNVYLVQVTVGVGVLKCQRNTRLYARPTTPVQWHWSSNSGQLQPDLRLLSDSNRHLATVALIAEDRVANAGHVPA